MNTQRAKSELRENLQAVRPATGLEPSRSAAHRRVELELERRRVERLVGRSRSSALGPMGHHIVGSTAPVVMRRSSGWIERPPEALPVTSAWKPPEAVHLDDVADLYAFEPHRDKSREAGARSRSWTVCWTVLSSSERFLAIRSGRAQQRERRPKPREHWESAYHGDAGGGTRTPDTRIMIPLL